MKKETFVSLINILEDYKKKSTKFGEAVSKAYVEAGLERDFAAPCAYEFPYGQLADKIVKAIAKEFEDENYSAEVAEDFINWWLWETDFGKETYFDVPSLSESDKGKNTTTKYMAEVTFSDGKTYIIKTATKLYDVILIDKKLRKKENKK